MAVAYAVRQEYRDGYLGGVVHVGANGETIDKLVALKDPLVVDEADSYATTALDGQPDLERVKVPVLKRKVKE